MSDKKEKKIKPVDNTKVYSTDKLKAIYPVIGTEIEVHTSQAEKLIASGKATKEKPTSKPSKDDKDSGKDDK